MCMQPLIEQCADGDLHAIVTHRKTLVHGHWASAPATTRCPDLRLARPAPWSRAQSPSPQCPAQGSQLSVTPQSHSTHALSGTHRCKAIMQVACKPCFTSQTWFLVHGSVSSSSTFNRQGGSIGTTPCARVSAHSQHSSSRLQTSCSHRLSACVQHLQRAAGHSAQAGSRTGTAVPPHTLHDH